MVIAQVCVSHHRKLSFPKRMDYFILLTARLSFNYSTSSPKVSFIRLLNVSHFSGCWSSATLWFYLHFSDYWWCWLPFHVFIGLHMFSFVKCLLKYFMHFKIGVLIIIEGLFYEFWMKHLVRHIHCEYFLPDCVCLFIFLNDLGWLEAFYFWWSPIYNV